MKRKPKAAPVTPRRPEMILVVSDIHAGSHHGLMPPHFKLQSGQYMEQNPFQEWLWKCWVDMSAWVFVTTAGANFAAVINGDLIEGDHHGTKEIWSKDLTDHQTAAEEILRPLIARASHTFIVKGTECHTNGTETTLGKILRTEINPDTGLPSFDRLHLTVHGCRCAFSHHIGTSTRSWSEATQMASILAEEALQACKNGEQFPQVVGRAHRHKYGTFSNGRQTAIVSPPWQGLTRHGHKVVPEARTQPGAYILDWRGKPEGALPEVHERLYQAPAQTGVTL